MRGGRGAAVAVVILLAAGFGNPAMAEPKAVRIGVQLPLSGERAGVGRAIKSGVEMAVEAVNRQGGVGGMPVEVVYEDDRDTEQGARAALEKLVREHQVVAVVGELFSRYVIACRDIVEQAQVSFLTGGTSPRATEGTRWIFRVGASDALLAELLARYAVEDLKLRKLAILHDRTGIHNVRAEMVAKVLQERYGIKPLIKASWKPGDRDFTRQLDQIKTHPVEAILALGETGEGGPFLQQVKSLGLEARVVAHRDFGVRQALEEAGRAAEGVMIMTEYIPMLQAPEQQAWARAYRERYGTEPSVISAQYHDAVLLLAEAAKRGGASREGVRVGLERLTAFRGVMADYTFDARQNGVHRFYLVRIVEGKPTLVRILEGKP
jgi:branched-chain amino acid transport system substrate-binding protein